MEKAIIGKKIGMTQIFDEAGRVVPVTLIQAGPCTVVQKKTAEKDGYEAIQLGYQETPERKLTRPEIGHQKKAGLTEYKKVLKEFALKDCSKYEVGDVLTAKVFAAGDYVDVTGTSKGHGFQGVVKRHGAAVKRNTHGGGPVHRHQGSLGPGTTPGHIAKGRDGAGQMGNVQVTVQKLDVVQVDEELGVIAVRGAVPGPRGGVVALRTSAKKLAEKHTAEAAGRVNPQKQSARVNPQKASARSK